MVQKNDGILRYYFGMMTTFDAELINTIKKTLSLEKNLFL